jgi:anti-anti-sigma factor
MWIGPKGDSMHGVGDTRITVSTAALGTVVVVGEVDASTAPLLHQRLTDNGVTSVDCSGVTFFGGAGLRTLLDVARRQPGGRLRLASPSPAVLRLIELCDQGEAFLIDR